MEADHTETSRNSPDRTIRTTKQPAAAGRAIRIFILTGTGRQMLFGFSFGSGMEEKDGNTNEQAAPYKYKEEII